MSDRHKLGQYANHKGHGYEREIAKQLTPWYNATAKEPLKEAFYIVPDSGARAWSASMNVDGDVTADPTIKFNYLIECKRYEGWTIENLLTGTFNFSAWIAQSVREGLGTKRVPLLVYKRNYIKTFITAPYNVKLTELLDPYIVKTLAYNSEVTGKKESIRTITFKLDDFLKIPFDVANHLYDSVDWTNEVHSKKNKKKKLKSPTNVADDILKHLNNL
jgi:hypothetical protein